VVVSVFLLLLHPLVEHTRLLSVMVELAVVQVLVVMVRSLEFSTRHHRLSFLVLVAVVPLMGIRLVLLVLVVVVQRLMAQMELEQVAMVGVVDMQHRLLAHH
jgi:hypothetical protein